MPTLAEINRALAEVYDPELDTPITELGFVNEVQIADGHVTVTYTVPTFWCAPNFVFMMSQDIRDEVGRVPGVIQVTVLVRNNCLEDEINRGVNAGRSFAETFPADVDQNADLEVLRHTFNVKGFLARQDVLIRRMRQAGLADNAILTLRLGDVKVQGEDLILSPPPHRVPLAAADLLRYLHKRRRLQLSVAAEALLFTTVAGQSIAETELATYLRYSRSARLNIAFNTSLCEGLLRTQFFPERQHDHSSVGDRLMIG
ncbi:iron-sulfur cluster assembly protein [uncultured Chloroflexus sp.]|uniref:metal-sulfur cluster assembly factor n=1 Tax=uncultured Chloroflexus sp. TaxID=214040 RepID=UPI002629F75A|nr:iron-sulfur cluster assembly protein [uncultured Chloroflexus sp.]